MNFKALNFLVCLRITLNDKSFRMKLYNIRTKEIDIISNVLSFTFYAKLVQIKPVSRLSLLENVLCNPCSLACFLSYFHFYIYMMQSHSWMSYLTKEYAEKEALCLENVNVNKADLPQVSIFFRTQFPSLGIFINKKVGIWKN